MSFTAELPHNQEAFARGDQVYDIGNPAVRGVIYDAGLEQSEVKFEGERTPRIVLTKYLRVVSAEAEVDGAASIDKDSIAAFNWRAHLRIHPAAELLPLMSEAALKEHVDDIKANGLRAPLVLWASCEGEFLLHGRDQLDALALLGLLYETCDHHVGLKKWTGKKWSDRPDSRIGYARGCKVRTLYDGDPYAIALSLNNAEQKRETLPSDPAVEAIEPVEISTEIVKAETTAPPSCQSNTRSRKAFAKLINAAWRKGAEAFIDAGRYLLEAKAELDRDVFDSLVKHLDFDPSVGRKLMAIAGNSVICAHGHKLPPCWTTLYELTKFDDDVLETWLADGTIHPGMKRKDAVAAPRHKPKDVEPDDGGNPGEPQRDDPSWLLRRAWEVTAPEIRAKVIQDVPVADLIAFLSDAQRAELFDRIVGQQIAQASPVAATPSSERLLTNLTGTLHWALSQADPVNGAEGLKRIAAKLAVNKRDPRDVCLAFAQRAKR